MANQFRRHIEFASKYAVPHSDLRDGETVYKAFIGSDVEIANNVSEFQGYVDDVEVEIAKSGKRFQYKHSSDRDIWFDVRECEEFYRTRSGALLASLYFVKAWLQGVREFCNHQIGDLEKSHGV